MPVCCSPLSPVSTPPPPQSVGFIRRHVSRQPSNCSLLLSCVCISSFITLKNFFPARPAQVSPSFLLSTSARTDRGAQSCGKSNGLCVMGVVIIYINRWCTPDSRREGGLMLLLTSGSRYLPREFIRVMVVGVYGPPRADAAAACEKITKVLG